MTTKLIDYEHLYGDKAITIGKFTYPLASPVSEYIKQLEEQVDVLNGQDIGAEDAKKSKNKK